MMTLLKMHFYMSRKLLVLSFFFILGVIAIQWLISNQINLGFLSVYFLIYTPALSISFLLENHFIMNMRTMPIVPKDFVKSLFIFCLLLALIITVPIIFYQAFLYVNTNIGQYEFSFIFLIFAAGIASIGSMLKKYLSDPSKDTKSFSIGAILFYLFLFLIAHFIIMLLFNLMDLKIIGAFVTPIIGLLTYFKQYQSALKAYKATEF